MGTERKELSRISRREFLIGAGLAAIAAGCKRVAEKLPVVVMEDLPTFTPEPSPTATPEPAVKPTEKPTNTPRPTETREPTPTKEEIIRIPGVTITEELLKKAFEGVGGGEMIEPSAFATPTPGSAKENEKPMPFINFIEEYLPDAWNQEITPQELTENPLASLKCMVALGTYAGAEGVFSPGGTSGNEVFPYLFEKGVHFLRVRIPEVPSEREQQLAEFQEGVMPADLTLRPDTHLTVVGKFKGELVSPALEQMEYALVAPTDWFRKYIRKEESMAPFHYWGIVPVSLPGDPENKKAFTLENLLAKGGVSYDKETGEASFTDSNGKKVIEGINEIEGKELVEAIVKDGGIWFVDQIKGEVIANPIVPYPPEDLELPAYWTAQRKEENGKVFISLEGGESMEEEFKELAQARYDGEKGEWGWQRSVESNLLLELAKAPEIEGLKAYLEDDKIVYRAKAGNPYKLEAGNYAGEVVHYIINQKPESGIGLVSSVLEVLAKEHQTPEALKEKREKFPLFFDPRGVEFGMEEIKYPFIDREGKEYQMTYLGLNLPVGTSIYCPVPGGEFGGSEKMMFVFNYNLWLFPTPERESELGEKCLNEGLCGHVEMRSGKRLVEPSKVVLIRAEEGREEELFTMVPFQIFFSWQSEVEADLYKATEKDSHIFWKNKKESFMGRKLFTLDTDKPVAKYAAPVNYSIVIRGRQGLTTFESLYKVKDKGNKDRLVFILPKGGEE